jgi:hypothetical protein
MFIELHNFTWEGERLVQVATEPHHIAGVLSEIREILSHSECEWENIYSAYYECDKDGTVTFYEGESAEAGKPGIWTYIVYDCAPGEEEVVANLDIDTLEPALQLKRIVVEVAAIANHTSAEQAEKLTAIAKENKLSFEVLLSLKEVTQQNHNNNNFEQATRYVLNKNAELYRRLA